jgi:hypothetical protein
MRCLEVFISLIDYSLDAFVSQIAQVSEGQSEISPRFCLLAASALINEFRRQPAPVQHDQYSLNVAGGRREYVKFLTEEIGHKYAGMTNVRV